MYLYVKNDSKLYSESFIVFIFEDIARYPISGPITDAKLDTNFWLIDEVSARITLQEDLFLMLQYLFDGSKVTLNSVFEGEFSQYNIKRRL